MRIISVIFIALTFFILSLMLCVYIYKTLKSQNVDEKIRRTIRLVDFFWVFKIITFVIGMLGMIGVTLWIVQSEWKISLAVLFQLLFAGIELYLFYGIYKQVKQLLTAFYQEEIFTQENGDALTLLSKQFTQLFLINVFAQMFILVYGILMMMVDQMALAFSGINLNFNLNMTEMMGITLYLLIALVFQIVAIVFNKACVIKKENDLTI